MAAVFQVHRSSAPLQPVPLAQSLLCCLISWASDPGLSYAGPLSKLVPMLGAYSVFKAEELKDNQPTKSGSPPHPGLVSF
jgi:hypothetical protein